MVDEEQHCSSLHMVVCVARPARGFETPFLIADTELNQLIRNSTAMYLPDPIDRGSIRRRRNSYVGFPMLLAGKRHASTMHCVSANNIENFGILLSSRTKGSAASGYVIE